MNNAHRRALIETALSLIPHDDPNIVVLDDPRYEQQWNDACDSADPKELEIGFNIMSVSELRNYTEALTHMDLVFIVGKLTRPHLTVFANMMNRMGEKAPQVLFGDPQDRLRFNNIQLVLRGTP